MIIYEGPSKIDKEPIVCIMTTGSKNIKTGDMAQTWILRSDISPVEAIKSGEDKSICGSCPQRGTSDGEHVSGRGCYVQVYQAPLSVWNAYKRGKYKKYDDEECRKILAGKTLRIGAYGDPCSISVHIWERLIRYAKSHTSYTHRWANSKVLRSRFRKFSMASCDSELEAIKAKANGWRYFRVRKPDDPILDNEITCPASKEAGHKTTCNQCRLCGGADKKAKNITIMAHGSVSTISNATKNLIRVDLSKLKRKLNESTR